MTDEPPPLALLAHELRTPLNALIGYADAMRGAVFGPLPAPYDDQARIIHGAALHLLALVDDMTDIARAEAGVWTGARQRVDLADLAREQVALFSPRAAGRAVALSADVAPHAADAADAFTLVGDRRALAQALINLLDNALRHTSPGGAVTVGLAARNGDLVLSVADSGAAPGAPSVARGEGLGLRLVRAVCALHGGALEITAKPAGGVVAALRLPAEA